ncbi:hypothetical protein PSAR109036_01900 [Psychrobacter arenosus]|uniref:hypothetical protein n=1 Tax=Psychrobacter arenosus TaxID=256326 RepID=UPI00191B2B6F|nr:hypothetical protein [Psychrobacter arenosus]
MNKVIQRRFGTSPRLSLSNLDWLEHGMHAKTVRFDIGQGGEPPSVTWEDRSAAIALIDSSAAKSLASLLLWGGDEKWDWAVHFNEVVGYLAKAMLQQCRIDGRQAPKGSEYSLEELARLMARMTLHFELYDLWSLYTVEGRLLFSGINVSASTYSQVWAGYQKAMLDNVGVLAGAINIAVHTYRRNLDEART